MRHKIQPAIPKSEDRFLSSVLGGALKYFALSLGMTTSIALLLFALAAFIKASQANHVTYDLASLSSGSFRHFALVIGGVFAVLMLMAGLFLLAFIKNLRNSKDLDDFVVYLKYKQRKRDLARMAVSTHYDPTKLSRSVIGAASILDFRNTLAPSALGLTPSEQDYLAIKSDWAAVGSDLQASMNEVDRDLVQDRREALIGAGGRSA